MSELVTAAAAAESPVGDPRPKGDGVAIVHMSAGWWVAICGRLGCMHAEWFGLARNGAGVGGLTAEYMACPECGWTGPARWPAEDLRVGVEALLALRPVRATRNWLPGESLHDLLVENAEHGIGVPVVEPDRAGVLLEIRGDAVTHGLAALRAGAGRPELTEPGRLAIGGQ